MGRQIDPRILDDVALRVTESKTILDVGGAWEGYKHATAVLDIEAGPRYEPLPNVRDWYVGDACRPSTWDSLGDNQFDFAVCTHTLEDVYDPFTILEGMSRVAKAGYIEVPSAFAETMHFAKEFPYEFNGYLHHHWIFELSEPEHDGGDFGLVGTIKRPELLIPRLTEMTGQPGDWRRLSFMGLFWEGSIEGRFNDGAAPDIVQYFKDQRVKWEDDFAMQVYSPVTFQKSFVDKFTGRLPREGRIL